MPNIDKIKLPDGVTYDVKDTTSGYQTASDNNLQTTSKTITGAINEVNAKPSVTSLSALTDVTIATPTNGQTLKYNSTSQKWVNGEGGITWGSIAGTLSNQTDLNTALTGKVNISDLVEVGAVIKTTYNDSLGGYTIWSNGFCIQWEYPRQAGSTTYTRTFLKTFKTAPHVSVSPHMNSTAEIHYRSFGYNITTTGFSSYVGTKTDIVSWIAIGYLAEGEY